jgi:hypothetical protein
LASLADPISAVAGLGRDVPDQTAVYGQVRSNIIAAIEGVDRSRSTFNVILRDGIVQLDGIVTDERCRQQAIVAEDNVTGISPVHDELCSYLHPEEDLGNGDFVSLNSNPSTTYDVPF